MRTSFITFALAWTAPAVANEEPDETQLLQRSMKSKVSSPQVTGCASNYVSIVATATDFWCQTNCEGGNCPADHCACANPNLKACPNYHFPAGPGSFNGKTQCNNIANGAGANHKHCKDVGYANFRKCPGACGRTYEGDDYREECRGVDEENQEGSAPEPCWPACFCGPSDPDSCWADCVATQNGVDPAKTTASDGNCAECPANGEVEEQMTYSCPNYHMPQGPGSFNGKTQCNNIANGAAANHKHCKDRGYANYRKCPGACGRTFTDPNNWKEQCRGVDEDGDEGHAPDPCWPACFCGPESPNSCWDDCVAQKMHVHPFLYEGTCPSCLYR